MNVGILSLTSQFFTSVWFAQPGASNPRRCARGNTTEPLRRQSRIPATKLRPAHLYSTQFQRFGAAPDSEIAPDKRIEPTW